MVLRELGGRTRGGFSPQEWLSLSAPEILLDVGAAAAPKGILAPLAVSGLATSASGGFDMAAIRPARELPAFTANQRSPLARSRSWDAAISAALHVAALVALLTWATPVTETESPEPVTIEIVADTPAHPVRPSEAAPAPPTPTVVEPPPVVQSSPPPVAEAPPPPVVEPSPQVAEAPPPPPVAEPSPPVAEAPPPPVAEPSPPPVAEAPPPTPVVEPTPRPAPVASPAPPRVPKPMPTTASSATARVAKPPPSERPTPPKVAKPTPPEKTSPTISREPRESSRPASRATKLASLPPQPVAPAVSSAEAAAYQGEVIGRIAAQKRYPEAARERAPQGVAIVRFSIAASGQLAGASLVQSAGDPLLDAEALATVHRASPFPPPPAGAPRNFSAPLSYRVR
ncbi:MAG TPA: TonB family protein [Roseiarcus sp.]|jgi:protein TonB